MEFRDIDRRSVVEQVAEQLREAVIVAVRASTGLPSETHLSEAMTVSRPTLREALRILEAEGLVHRDYRTAALRPGADAAAMSRPLRSALDFLSRTDRITYAEIVDLQMTIEGRAAERAAGVATAEELETLGAALERMQEPGVTGEDWEERRLAFHLAMVTASHNEAFLLITLAAGQVVADILKRAADSVLRAKATGAMARQRAATNPLDPEWTKDQCALHARIHEAIRNGRGSDAREAVWGDTFGFFGPLMGETMVKSGFDPARIGESGPTGQSPGK
jgi:GntR family transcriptional repressor for pyruvate dehydrogenase complex